MPSKLFASFILFALIAFGFSPAQAQIYFPEMEPWDVYQNAIQMAEQRDKPLLVVLGINGCVWCDSIEKMIHSSADTGDIYEKFWVAEITVDAKAQPVIDDLKKRAGITQKLPGYPYLFAFNTKTNSIVPIPTGILEENGPDTYGHNRDLVINAIEDAHFNVKAQCLDLFAK